MVKVLEEFLNLNENDDILEWWLWDLSFGTKYKQGCIKDEQGNFIDVSTPEKLYDYIKEKNNGK